jgi:ABC-type antimicrobial peptide transport system permease subunit
MPKTLEILHRDDLPRSGFTRRREHRLVMDPSAWGPYAVGIRVALGATTGDVVGMFVREGAWITAAGIAVGVPLAFALTLFLRSQLYTISPADPLTYGAIALLLLAVAVYASLFPALRAARVDPVRSLRTE